MEVLNNYLANSVDLYGGSGGGGGVENSILDVNVLPISNIKENVFYRTNNADKYFIYNNQKYQDNSVVCYKCDGTYAYASGTQLNIELTPGNIDSYSWNTVDDTLINDLLNQEISGVHPIEIVSFDDCQTTVDYFIKYDTNKYDSASNFTKQTDYISQLQYYKNNEWHIVDNLQIDSIKLTPTTTRANLELIGEEDIIKNSDFETPKASGIDIVLDDGQASNPDIINDDVAYKYANNKTSSNNYINTRLETIERKADAKTLTKFVDALPANPDINTEYYVETSTPNVYDRYFVDSIGTVKEIGNTTMDVSTLATKTELNLKEDLSNKTTTLDDNSTNTQYPSAKSVVDYVKDSAGGSQIVETVLWQSPNGIGGTGFNGNTNITLLDNIKDYYLFKFTVSRNSNNILSYYLTKNDISAYNPHLFTPIFSYDGAASYLNVILPADMNTNVLRINVSTSCNLVNITGYKSIPMLNTYSREIRELIMNTPVGGTASGQSKTITLTKGMSNYDYLDFYYKTATSNDNAYDIKRVAVKDFINYFNSTTVNCSLEIFDLDSQRRWCKFYRTADTTFAATITNMYIQKIEGIKAEPVVQGSPAYKQLFYSANGVSSGNITLNDDLSKFSYIEMIARSQNTATPAVGSSKLGTNYFINKNSLIIVNQQWEGNSTLFTYIKYVNNTTVSVTNAGGGAVIEIIGWY